MKSSVDSGRSGALTRAVAGTPNGLVKTANNRTNLRVQESHRLRQERTGTAQSSDMLKWRYNKPNSDCITDNLNYNNNSNNQQLEDLTSSRLQGQVDQEDHPGGSVLFIKHNKTMTSSGQSGRPQSPAKHRLSPISLDEETVDKDEHQMTNVLEVVNSLKLQVDKMKSELQMSAQTQESLVRELGDLRLERSALINANKPRNRVSLRRIAIANSSQSSQEGGRSPRAGNSLEEDDEDTYCTISDADLEPCGALNGAYTSDDTSEDDVDHSFCRSLSRGGGAYDKSGNAIRSSRGYRQRTERGYGTLQHNKSQSLFDIYDKSHTSRRQLLAYQNAQRLQLLRSLAESERTYCTDLWQLTENYSKLLYSTGALNKKELSQIFPSYLIKVYEQHCLLLKAVHRRLTNWDYSDVSGDIFYRFSRNKKIDLFAVYKTYIEQFPKTVRVINRLCRTSGLFRKVLSKSYKDGGVIGNGQSLIYHLIQPIKRLPHYYAFIKDTLDVTPENHPDRKNLDSALDIFQRNLAMLTWRIEGSLQYAGQPLVRSRFYLDDPMFNGPEPVSPKKRSPVKSPPATKTSEGNETYQTIKRKLMEKFKAEPTPRGSLSSHGSSQSSLALEDGGHFNARPSDGINQSREAREQPSADQPIASAVGDSDRPMKFLKLSLQRLSPDDDADGAEEFAADDSAASTKAILKSMAQSTPNLANYDPSQRRKPKARVTFRRPIAEAQVMTASCTALTPDGDGTRAGAKPVRMKRLAQTLRTLFTNRTAPSFAVEESL